MQDEDTEATANKNYMMAPARAETIASLPGPEAEAAGQKGQSPASPLWVPLSPSLLSYPCPGERKIPSYLSAVTTPWGGERFSVLVPLYPLQLQVAEAGQG